LIAGAALNLQSNNTNTGCGVIGVDGAQIFVNSTGLVGLSVPYNTGATTFMSSVALPLNTWNYLELYTIAGQASNGTAIVRVNGVTVINRPSIITSNAAAYSSVSIGPSYENLAYWLDDFYVCDNTGTANNNFLGDIKIVTLMPNGAGSSTQFNPVGAPTNWQAVSPAAPQGDLSYVTDATAGDKDLYTIPSITGSGIVCGVQLSMYARKDDAGSRSISGVVSLESTTAQGDSIALGSSYHIYTEQFQVNPATGTAWTYPDINQLQIGVEVSA
jgi:hypothetical protein